MDAGKLGFSYNPAMLDSAQPADKAKLEDKNPYNLPDLGSPPEPELRYQGDRLEFINPNFSNERPMLSLQVKPNYGFVDQEAEIGKLRSPYLQKQAQLLAKEMIQEPLKDAISSRSLDARSATALGLGLGGLAAAVYSPSEVKSRITLYKAEVGDYALKPSLGITSGGGKIDYKSAKLNFSPQVQGSARWNMDLEYRPENDEIGLSYNRSVSKVQVGPSAGQSYLQAGVSKSHESGTRAYVSYNLNF